MKHATASGPNAGGGRHRARLPPPGGKGRGHDPRTSGWMLRYASVTMLCAAAAAVIVLA
jgi:hypothetical protein